MKKEKGILDYSQAGCSLNFAYTILDLNRCNITIALFLLCACDTN